MEGLLAYQSENGLWRQLVDYPEAWEETSASAMFAYSMITGIRLGWLDEKIYGPVVEKTWLSFVDKLNENGELEEVCMGTNEKYTAKEYLDRPRKTGDFHGQAPLLWAAEAFLRLAYDSTNNPDTKDPEASFSVYSQAGSLTFSEKLSKSQCNTGTRIDVSHMDNGLYIYRIKQSDRTFTGRLIILRSV